MVPVGLLGAGFVIGLLRASEPELDAATVAGMVTGALVPLSALALVLRSRRTSSADDE